MSRFFMWVVVLAFCIAMIAFGHPVSVVEPAPVKVPDKLFAPTYPLLISMITNATQTSTLVYITWSPSGGYQMTGMFTKSTLPPDLRGLPVYTLNDIGPGPLRKSLDELLRGIVWTP